MVSLKSQRTPWNSLLTVLQAWGAGHIELLIKSVREVVGPKIQRLSHDHIRGIGKLMAPRVPTLYAQAANEYIPWPDNSSIPRRARPKSSAPHPKSSTKKKDGSKRPRSAPGARRSPKSAKQHQATPPLGTGWTG